MAHQNLGRNSRNQRRAAPQQPQPQNPGLPEWHDRAANAHGKETQALTIPTRELQMNIQILASWLANPDELRKLSRDDRIEMNVRLNALRAERKRRNERYAARAQQRPSNDTNRAPRGRAQTSTAQPQVAH